MTPNPLELEPFAKSGPLQCRHRRLRKCWGRLPELKVSPDVINYSAAFSAFGLRMLRRRPVAADLPPLSSVPEMKAAANVIEHCNAVRAYRSDEAAFLK